MNRRTFLRAVSAAPTVAVAQFRTSRSPISGEGTIRVGVFGLFRPTTLHVRAVADPLALIADGAPTVLRHQDLVSLRAGAYGILIEHGGASRSARAVEVTTGDGRTAGMELAVPGRIVRRFSGSFTIAAVDGVLVPVVTIALETAVASVVAAEQHARVPHEALSAQAIAARSYFVASGRRHDTFDACDTTHCQFLRDVPASNHPAWQAVTSTTGACLTFRDTPVAALYSASCGGRTRSLVEAGLSRGAGYPFYSVACRYCAQHAAAWERVLPLDADARRLEVERSETARLALGRRGDWSLVPSNTFETRREGDSLVVRGRGAGHGIGLCQAGAAHLAGEGHTWREILAHYYPGTAVRAARW